MFCLWRLNLLQQRVDQFSGHAVGIIDGLFQEPEILGRITDDRQQEHRTNPMSRKVLHPARRHRTTVAGWTTCSAFFQPDQR